MMNQCAFVRNRTTAKGMVALGLLPQADDTVVSDAM
jgi:hypothetical protein